jgi:hypothetical protein
VDFHLFCAQASATVARLAHPGVSVVMSLRRGGLLLFGEKNGLQKLPAVIGILVGIVFTVVG